MRTEGAPFLGLTIFESTRLPLSGAQSFVSSHSQQRHTQTMAAAFRHATRFTRVCIGVPPSRTPIRRARYCIGVPASFPRLGPSASAEIGFDLADEGSHQPAVVGVTHPCTSGRATPIQITQNKAFYTIIVILSQFFASTTPLRWHFPLIVAADPAVVAVCLWLQAANKRRQLTLQPTRIFCGLAFVRDNRQPTAYSSDSHI